MSGIQDVFTNSLGGYGAPLNQYQAPLWLPTSGNNGSILGTQAPPVNNVAPAINNNQQQTQQTNTSGLDPHINPNTGVWDDTYFATHNGQSGGTSDQDLTNQINALFDPQFSYLNQAEGNLRNDYASNDKNIQGNYDVNSQLLSDANKTANDQYDVAKVSGFNQKEDALSSARRLYDQLRTGYQQRFGGSTSAGGAASEIASAEQQRQMGGVQRDYGTLMSTIDVKRADLDRGYSTSVMQLKQATDQAKSTAWSDFQSKLLSITQSRGEIESAKSQAKLSALNDYRNKVFAISQQNLQYQQNLQLMKEQASMTLSSYQKQLLASNSGVSDAFNTAMGSMSANPTSNLQVGNTGQQQTSNLTGQMTGKTIKGYDIYGNPVYS